MDGHSQEHNILKGYNMLLYFAGSMVMYEPTEECIIDFWENGILKNLPVSSSNPNFIKAASQLRESCTDRSECTKILHEDFVRLFSSDQHALAPAYETLYLNKGIPQSGNTNGSVTEFYNSYGWKSKFKSKIKDDHLGVELLFLTVLIDKYMLLDDAVCLAEMKKEVQRYISNHILSWIADWNKKVQTYSKTLSFKGIGTLILACTEDIYSIMGEGNINYN